MKLFELIEYFDKHGVAVRTVEGKLNVTADDGVLDAPVMDALRRYKKEVAAYYDRTVPAPGTAVPGDAALPLSFAQRRLYFLYQYDRSSGHFNLPIELGLEGRFEPQALRRALAHVIDRRPIYATTYEVLDGRPVQRHRPELQCVVEFEDLSRLGEQAQAERLAALRAMSAALRFDLEREAPLRARLLATGARSFVLQLVFHHIATDEWSILQLLREVAEVYRVLKGGGPAPALAAPAAYADYVRWQLARFERGGYEAARSFWNDHLAGAPAVLELPCDRPRPAQQSFRGGTAVLALPDALRERVAAQARTLAISEFSFYLGLYYLLLGRLTGQRDLVVGTDVYGRENEAFRDVSGFFVNQLPLRARLPDGALGVAEFLQQVNAVTARSLHFQEIPFEQIVDDMKVDRDPAHSPLFQVKFLYRRNELELDVFEGARVYDRQAFALPAHYDLTLQVQSGHVRAIYNADLFAESTVQQWLGLYLNLAEEACEAPGRAVRQLLAAPLAALAAPHAHGEHKEVTHHIVLERIALAARMRPDAVAVRGIGKEVSYGEFDARMQAVARQLVALAVRPGDKVGVFLERSVDMVVAMVAVLRVGAVLVPLEPDYPADYIDETLSDSGAAVVITNAVLADALGEFYGVTLDIAALYRAAAVTVLPEPEALAAEEPAYLLYTSGSTGRPKGVLVPRAALANLCDWYIDFARIDASSKVLLMIPVGFDAALKNILAPLMCGAELVLGAPSGFDPDALLAQIAATGVTVVNSVPAALYALLRADRDRGYRSLGSIRCYAVGGEALDPELVQPWLLSAQCGAELANIYGPTECTDIAVAFKGDAHAWAGRRHAPIGRPIQNVQAFVVDQDLAPCPPGVPGELLIGGRGVAIGYHGLPAASAERFVRAALSEQPLYRTGDFCRYDRDGNLLYLGRRDSQIKVRGKRVEIGEVMAAMADLLPGRATSVQLYARHGLEMLVGFADGAQPDDPGMVLQALARRLPRHAVPAQLLFLPALPLSANGKVDGGALLALLEARRSQAVDAPGALNPTEAAIAAVWERVLGTPVKDPRANFFSLGGDSIFSIPVVAELNRLGFEVGVAAIFKYPVLEELARACAEAAPHARPVQAAPLEPFALLDAAERAALPSQLEDAYPLTALQQGMLFHCRLEPSGSMYQDVFCYDLRFDYDAACFTRAIGAVVQANPALRTGFECERFARVLQLVYSEVQPRIARIDLSALPAAQQAERAAAAIADIKASRFELDSPSLIRFTVLEKGEGKITLVIDAHHIILDGWSMATLQRQLFDQYWHIKEGAQLGNVFDTGKLRYADYVAGTLRDEVCAEARQYWAGYCQRLGSGEISPAWAAAPAVRIHSLQLAPALVAQLASRVQQEHVPLKTLLLMAHAYMLRTLVDSDRLCTLLTDNGRPEVQGAQNLVGLFLNVLPLGVELDAGSWRVLGRQVQQDEVQGKPFRRYPFARIAQQCRSLKPDTIFTYNNFHVVEALRQAPGLEIGAVDMFEESNFKLSALVHGNLKSGLTLVLALKIALNEEQSATLMREFVFALECMARDYDAPVPVARYRGLPCAALVSGAEGEAQRCLIAHDGPVDVHAAGEALARARLLAWTAGRHELPCVPGVAQADEPGRELLSLELPSGTSGPGLDRLAGAVLERYRAALHVDPGLRMALGADGARWEDPEALARDARFWTARLARLAPVPEAPRARRELAVALSPALADDIAALARRTGVRSRTPWIAAWVALTARLSGMPAVGTALALPEWRSGQALPLAVEFDGRQPAAACLSGLDRLIDEMAAHLGSCAYQLVQGEAHARGAGHGCATGLAFVGSDVQGAGIDRLFGAYGAPGLVLAVGGEGAEQVARLRYAPDLFVPAQVERIAACLQTLLGAMMANDAQPVGTLAMLPAAEREQLLEGFNDTAMPYPGDQLIHQLFEEQARAQPDAIALVYRTQRLSYAELNRRANAVAHRLIALGIQPDDRVALCTERSPEMLVGLLGILKAGGAYVPLDPAYPAERLAYTLEDSAPAALLTQQALRSMLPAAVPVIALDDPADMAAVPTHDPDPAGLGLAAHNLAYVIYTSGSTGRPKGVMVEHRSVVNLWRALDSAIFDQFGHPVSVAMNASLAFDASVKCWIQLLSGRRLVLVPAVVRGDGAALCRYLAAHEVDVFDCTPVQLEWLLDAGLGERTGYRPKAVMIGGDAIAAATWSRLTELPAVGWYNVYGPTECTVDASIARIDAAPRSPHLGRPIGNARIYVLDGYGQPAPLGAAGEICIGGAGVARGYLNRSDLTAGRFLADPFGAMPGARLYKTGDLGRWREDGTLEYLGRDDFQVKIRGFRIELGEIEACLAASAGVDEAVVLAREDQPGDTRLVAYLTAQPGAAPSVAALRERMVASLPEYMLPSAFVLLDALPLTPNGKLDRKALPAPGLDAVLSREYEAPRDDTERAVAAVWQELLGLERVGRHDHFFELGGHSLLAVQLMSRVRKSCHVAVPLATLFAHPQLCDFSSQVFALQLESFMGQELASMEEELDGLSEAELLAILQNENENENHE